MKDRKEVITNGKAVFYSILYEKFRQTALYMGYALALHGSMASDMDLIAVAWIEDAKSPKDLVKAISDLIGETVFAEYHTLQEPTIKPHGRLSYTLSIYHDYYIDLSIIPPSNC